MTPLYFSVCKQEVDTEGNSQTVAEIYQDIRMQV